jgi:hypothetical protein
MKGSGPLYDELHALLDADAAPTPIHRFFASLPPVLRERGVPHQLLVTTSYDLALEAAFLEAGEEFDVVSYIAAGPNRGKFCHISPNGTGRLIDLPNTYATELSLEKRTVILKLHGQVDRGPEREWESFVVTEDDYIDYLSRSDVAGAVPVALAAKLRRSHFLFVGYMADWNLRHLNRLWSDQPLSYRSWAVQQRHSRSSGSSGAATSTSTTCRWSATSRRLPATPVLLRPRPSHERLRLCTFFPLQGPRAIRGLRSRRAAVLRA